ncbi:uncharacterized protein LOC113878587 isoform X2 [Bos indicus x Bos taurus]|uniref:uncharacterized protein LOC113878587 isoform X2 n=1 Tax=Bos indicus x Bos taurus TaxID=30522 RepID=UPI000F7D58CB|nr:uncharacterized protein LOC113878587 isoform X2 [Bos indicus x Bos taurus]
MGCGGRERRERGRRGELAACLPARSSRGRDAPHPSSSASPSKFPVPGRPDPGMATAARPPLRPFFQPPRRNLGQGRRDQTQTLALLGRSRRPPERGAGGFQDGADTLRTNPSHKFYFPFALEVLSGSRSTPARLARLPALPRQRNFVSTSISQSGCSFAFSCCLSLVILASKNELVAELIKKKADSYLPILCPFHLLPNIKPPAAFARSWLV